MPHTYRSSRDRSLLRKQYCTILFSNALELTIMLYLSNCQL